MLNKDVKLIWEKYITEAPEKYYNAIVFTLDNTGFDFFVNNVKDIHSIGLKEATIKAQKQFAEFDSLSYEDPTNYTDYYGSKKMLFKGDELAVAVLGEDIYVLIAAEGQVAYEIIAQAHNLPYENFYDRITQILHDAFGFTEPGEE